jgi:hypothetical protein
MNNKNLFPIAYGRSAAMAEVIKFEAHYALKNQSWLEPSETAAAMERIQDQADRIINMLDKLDKQYNE